MGLLDEAIREHLELKRRRGADPGAIARAERSALTPVFSEDEDHLDAHEEIPEHAPSVSDESPHEEPAPADFGWEDAGPSSATEQPEPEPDLREQLVDMPTEAHAIEPVSTTGQETAELDMSTVLGADETEPAPESAAAPTGETPAAPSGETPAEPPWETPAVPTPQNTAQPVPARTEAVTPVAAPAGRKWAGWRRGGREEPEEELEGGIPEEIPGQERIRFE